MRWKVKEHKIITAGFTMVEVIIIVVIIAILGAVAGVNVISHKRSLDQLELDGTAMEIYVAAQNHLSMAYAEQLVNLSGSGPLDLGTKIDNTELYYIGGSLGSTGDIHNTVLVEMLPFGSIDETIRMTGSYMIVYQPATGEISEVFYSDDSSVIQPTTSYADLESQEIIATKPRMFGDNQVGYYSASYGTVPKYETGLLSASAKIHNGDTLKVVIGANPGNDTNISELKLIIQQGTNQAEITGINYGDEVILDNVQNSEQQFYSLFVQRDAFNLSKSIEVNSKQYTYTLSGTNTEFIPGDEITVSLIVKSSTGLIDEVTSSIGTTNSLYETYDSGTKTATIKSFRHLMNLDKEKSHRAVDLINARQDKTLDWEKFGDDEETEIFIKKATKQYYPVSWKAADKLNYSAINKEENKINSLITTAGVFYEIEEGSVTGLELNKTKVVSGTNAKIGALAGSISNCTIKDIVVNDATVTCTAENSNAGGAIGSASGSTITSVVVTKPEVSGSNAGGAIGNGTNTSITSSTVLDAKVQGTVTVGGFAGTFSNSNNITVQGVIVRNTDSSTDPTIKGTNNAPVGGLIGQASGGIVDKCAAAVIVKSETGDAGGLIGNSSVEKVSNSYSGGHTKNGVYDESIVNVYGSTAGGLIGNASSTTIENCYSTCSAKGTSTVGGFIGNGSGSITNSYCVGTIYTADTTENQGAFAGVYSGSSNKAYYLTTHYYNTGKTSITAVPSKSDEDINIVALDKDLSTYNLVVYNQSKAHPYDPKIDTKRKYLTTISELNSSVGTEYSFLYEHYGDWQPPEIQVVNKRTD